MFRTLGLLTFGLFAATSASAASAHDEHVGADHNQIHGVRVEVHGNLDRYSVFGSGGRVEFAIVPNGFIKGNVRDELALSFGADVFFAPLHFGNGYYYNGGAYVIPIGAVQWNFYLGEHWSVFPELGVAVHAGFDRNGWKDAGGHTYGWLYPELDAGIGARYHFSQRVALLMRLSTPGGAQVGITF